MKRPLEPRDYNQIPQLSDPDVSPDGRWVAYTLSQVDTVLNRRINHIWMQSTDGRQSIQLTNSATSERGGRFSPDGKFLAFLSSRDSDDKAQLWLLDRRGGEGRRMTQVNGEIENLSWAPDGKRLVLSIKDSQSPKKEKKNFPEPIVLDRYHFKQDIEGYLRHQFTHLYIFSLESKKLDTLTKGDFDDLEPAWSPDGTKVAFVSNRTNDPDHNSNTDIYTIEPRPGAALHALTKYRGADHSPVWSPDGRTIAYLESRGSGDFIMYDQQNTLFIMGAEGEQSQALTMSMDRNVMNPCWARDGKSLGFLVSDDRKVYPAEVEIQLGKISRYAEMNDRLKDLKAGPEGAWITLLSKPQQPAELYIMENGILRRLTNHHQGWMKSVDLADVRGFSSVSKDSTHVNGLLYLPHGAITGKRYPLILFIHGGPVAQDEYDFNFTPQVLSQAGYAVATVNYRGSDGRGLAYTRAIYADWGNKEVTDLLGSVDELVKEGVADPGRLGIGGWSYGGILTNYTIATDPRFKAACSGAGSSLQLSMYGVDQYVLQYENELGAPWKNPEKWIKLSYPFFKVEQIKTPTLFMASEKDFNVPTVGSEQMYQALRSIGVSTELVIYPGQHHGITTPTFIIDRLNRYIAWYNRYLNTH